VLLQVDSDHRDQQSPSSEQKAVDQLEPILHREGVEKGSNAVGVLQSEDLESLSCHEEACCEVEHAACCTYYHKNY